MVEKMKIMNAAKGLFVIFGYSRKAVEKIKDGNYRESLDDVAGAVLNTVKSWNDIRYAWGALEDAVDSLSLPKQAALSAIQSQAGKGGYFTGRWLSSDRRSVELMYQDVETYALLLLSPRKDGSGHNVYKGGIYLEEGVLVWTGYNHLTQELIIIGVPDDEGHNISCHTWGRNPQTNEVTLSEQFVLSRM